MNSTRPTIPRISRRFFFSLFSILTGRNKLTAARHTLFILRSVSHTHTQHPNTIHTASPHTQWLCAIAARTNAFNNIPTEEQKTQNENDKLLWTNRIECRTNDDRIFLSYSAVSLYFFFKQVFYTPIIYK